MINWLIEMISSSEKCEGEREIIDWFIESLSGLKVSEWGWKIVN